MVLILLAAYNGEAYIKAQIESIQAQSYQKWNLVIRDDCSTDGTLQIIDEITAEDPRVFVLENQGTNLGAIRNFGVLMEFAVSKNSDYIFFADQDDVWMPLKLQTMLEVFKSKEALYGSSLPQLIYSDLSVVSEELVEISPSMMQYQRIGHEEEGGWKVLAVQNFVTGCSMAINHSLLRMTVPLPQGIVMHDWWIALYASVLGRITFIDKPLVQYRQHSKNQVGAKSLWGSLNPFRNSLLDSWKRGQKNMLLVQRQAGLLATILRADAVSDVRYDLLNAFSTICELPKLKRFKIIGKEKLHRQHWLLQSVLCCRIFMLPKK